MKDVKDLIIKINNCIQRGIFIDYAIIDQVENGSYEEGNQRYTYSFYITPKGEDWIYQISTEDIIEGYKECLEWLEKIQ